MMNAWTLRGSTRKWSPRSARNLPVSSVVPDPKTRLAESPEIRQAAWVRTSTGFVATRMMPSGLACATRNDLGDDGGVAPGQVEPGLTGPLASARGKDL